VQRAVIDGEQLLLAYTARDRANTTRVVHPLGLAAKGSTWYLVADTDKGLRTFRVDRINSVEGTGRPVCRPDGFELEEAWRLIADEIDQRRAPLRARVFAAPEAVGWCRATLGARVRIGPPGPDGRVELELRGHHPRSLAAELAGFGGLIEVIEPQELRDALATIGAELVGRYRRAAASVADDDALAGERADADRVTIDVDGPESSPQNERTGRAPEVAAMQNSIEPTEAPEEGGDPACWAHLFDRDDEAGTDAAESSPPAASGPEPADETTRS
jgi:hypothetical protein